MTKVFVHGNPETSAIWNPVVEELSARGINDVVLLSPPGFGASSPDGWSATDEAYRDWLIGELERIDGRIDLVGHDWGAGHVFNVLVARPDIVTTWAADCVGLMHPDYVWHDMAQAWQTPDIGEGAVDAMVNMSTEDFVNAFTSLGMTPTIATDVKAHINAEMARCILSLYRSAAQPKMREVGEAFVRISPPHGLAVIAEGDNFPGTPDMARHVADAAGASHVILHDVGHWWMIQKPREAVDALVRHWASVVA